MDHLTYLSNHMHFITNGYKRFSNTNLTDPRERVPLIMEQPSWISPIDINVTKPRLEEQNSLVPIFQNDYQHSLL